LFETRNYEYNSYLFTNELDRNYRVYFELGLFVFIYKPESKFVDFWISLFRNVCSCVFSKQVLCRHEPAVLLFRSQCLRLGKLENRETAYGKRASREKNKSETSHRPISAVAIAMFFLYYFVLANYTDSPLPKADSFTTALSIVATWMLARKMIENWILWVIVDGVSAGLYFYKELYPTAILFVIYTIMAVVGYWQWRKSI